MSRRCQADPDGAEVPADQPFRADAEHADAPAAASGLDRRLTREQLQVGTDEPAIGSAVLHCERMLAMRPLQGAWDVIGALAAGDRRRPSRWLADHGRATLEEAVQHVRRGVAPQADALATLLAAARNHAWTGVAGFTSTHRSLLRDAALALAQDGGSDRETGVLRTALRETAAAVQDAGDAAGAAAILTRLRGMPESTDPPYSFAAPAGDDPFLHDLRRMWRDCERGAAAGAGETLTRLATTLLDSEPGHSASDPLRTRRAAGFLAGLVHGLLGASPDAARHRIRISPILPPGWRSVSVRSLTLGDTSLSLTLTAAPSVLSYHLVQNTGAVPVRVVVEVRAARAPASVRLDGRAADLDVRAAPGGVVVPVQFELDAARRIELEWA